MRVDAVGGAGHQGDIIHPLGGKQLVDLSRQHNGDLIDLIGQHPIQHPQDEIAALMNLLLESIEEETLMKNNIRFNVIGDFKKLPVEVQKSLASCIERTSKNSGMYMVLALSYSSRWEITEAVRQIATLIKAGEMSPEQITDGCISSHLDTKFMPDPDLLIRTGGEIRLSNYLLWQCAYSELYFCDTFWGD